MKRTLLIAFAFLYMATSSGIAMNIHFCGQTISGIEFFGDNATCECGDLKMPKGCCKDVHHAVKITNEHSASKINFKSVSFQKLLTIINTHFIESKTSAGSNPDEFFFAFNKSAPPDLNIRYCVFRI